MITTITLKHSMSCLPDADIDVDIDAERLEVTLTLVHFDSSMVAHYVTRMLPELGVRAYRDDSLASGEHGLTPKSTYRLVVIFGGRRHLAQVVRLSDGRTTVWLENLRNDTEE